MSNLWQDKLSKMLKTHKLNWQQENPRTFWVALCGNFSTSPVMKQWFSMKIFTRWFIQTEEKQNSKNTKMMWELSLSENGDSSTFTIQWKRRTSKSMTKNGKTIKFRPQFLFTQQLVTTRFPRLSVYWEWENKASIKSRLISILEWTALSSRRSSTNATKTIFPYWLLLGLWVQLRRALSIIWLRFWTSRSEWWKKACFSTFTLMEPMEPILSQW